MQKPPAAGAGGGLDCWTTGRIRLLSRAHLV